MTSFPDCPRNEPSTCRFEARPSSTTLLYYPPRYDREGVNQNPDRNVTTEEVRCATCGATWFRDCVRGLDQIGEWQVEETSQ